MLVLTRGEARTSLRLYGQPQRDQPADCEQRSRTRQRPGQAAPLIKQSRHQRAKEAPQRIGELYLHQLGVDPGSLGNYAGLDMQIPVVTLELPSAGILPKDEEIRVMWRDLVAWLDSTGRKNFATRL